MSALAQTLAKLALAAVATIAAAPGAAQLPPPTQDTDFYNDGVFEPNRVQLGQALFFDKILSGNKNVSCATCHHVITATTDGLSLGIGEGGRGLSTTRNTGTGANAVVERVARNAPALFNLGAREFEVMFHDGRLAVDPSEPSGFASPPGSDLPLGLDNVLAAQALLAIASPTEMAGQPGENAQADLVDDLPALWDLVTEKLRIRPAYVDLFVAAFPAEVSQASDITVVHVGNALADFQASAWRADNSPFDRGLRGDPTALSPRQINGMRTFYLTAGCGDCHSGPFLTDHQFHAVGVPQIGPGLTPTHDDFGREFVTGDPLDRHRFRTPSLRNVTHTGPWGHSGAFRTLRSMVEHHLDALTSLNSYDRSQVVMPSRADLDAIDFQVLDDPFRIAEIGAAIETPPIQLTNEEIRELLDFLESLTDPSVLDLRSSVPGSVPSGLPLVE